MPFFYSGFGFYSSFLSFYSGYSTGSDGGFLSVFGGSFLPPPIDIFTENNGIDNKPTPIKPNLG